MRLVQLFLLSLMLAASRPLAVAVPFRYIVLRTFEHPTAPPSAASFRLFSTPLDPSGSVCVDETGKRVLLYLRDMMDLCRNLHRPDLLDQYSDAWELSATTIYGPLPARKPNQGYHGAAAVEPPTVAPKWKQQMLAKPYRKIVRRFTAIEDGLSLDYEQLACGHRVMALIEVPGEPQAQRRRCAECARETAAAKKQPASVISPSKKGATA